MMTATPIPRSSIATARLRLRPTSAADAERAFEIQNDWTVTRMLSNAAYPPHQKDVEDWFSDHAHEWADGTAYRFAIEQGERMIGVVDVDGIAGGAGSLGYWLERPAWGKGYAFEAAQALVSFAFHEIGLSSLESGHASDNPASGRVLTKLGFTPIGNRELVSKARRETIVQCCYLLRR
ncbi:MULTISPECIES: GNAT family N-acetyltransferase [unclassified Rhizobium]|jgi:ribosomal-protein-alanine N-acetyltransferase|uniref:GNAT family N-acetyltransferase n=1 Tax=unclassified Rhizobium TaxID=2613769 RepID=UPI0006455193|nr:MULTISPECIES: GNAT family N-acetyltransferase [unclassified Rhizobium]MBN8950689.1 GNAT family N-acetyltransferase [Rhizobium tropici]OJY66226.1 MAG: GNAT family N-acetyltransferase [Rhizobium sp. 60-20]RKD69209.1 RimJ/RimL family protein N-acetyltransferase [Rhizobium sp. WW_1]